MGGGLLGWRGCRGGGGVGAGWGGGEGGSLGGSLAMGCLSGLCWIGAGGTGMDGRWGYVWGGVCSSVVGVAGVGGRGWV